MWNVWNVFFSSFFNFFFWYFLSWIISMNVEKKWKVVFTNFGLEFLFLKKCLLQSLVNRNSEIKWENRSLLEISPPSLMWNDWCVINRNYYSNKFVVKWSAGCRVPDLWTILYVMDFYVLLSFLYIENLLR